MPTGAKPYTMSQFPTKALRPKPETPKPDALNNPFETLNPKTQNPGPNNYLPAQKPPRLKSLCPNCPCPKPKTTKP